MLSVLHAQPMYHLPSSYYQHHLPADTHGYQPYCRSAVDSTLGFSSSSIGDPSSHWTNKLLTGTKEMNALAPALQHFPDQEYGFQYGEGRAALERRTYGGPSEPVQGSGQSQQPHGSQLAPMSRPISPARRHTSVSSSTSHQRKPSATTYTIAPSLQIPRTVNSSRGSLAEMAAEITCLFWFESDSVLAIAENPSSASTYPQTLTPEAYPKTGFRKFVTTILSTTQVAQNVILLALLFIYRLKKLNPAIRGKLGSEYRLLTVALMLGNKFLDDNTYTNKTWADVAGISVMEVHIMEVEFLSNMKYNLFTSADEWTSWQTLLGRFANFFVQATRPQTASTTSSISPLTNSYLTAPLPSPPISYQASPSSATDIASAYNAHASLLTPQVQPEAQRLRPYMTGSVPAAEPAASRNPLKRGRDDDSTDHTVKRQAFTNPTYGPQHTNSTPSSARLYASTLSHDLPQTTRSVAKPASLARELATSQTQQSLQSYLPPQLPPISFISQPTTPSSSNTWQNSVAMSAFIGSATQPGPTPLPRHQESRQQSPYVSSASVSPADPSLYPGFLPTGQSQPPSSVSLSQRPSPYRPIRGVNTLLVAPPPQALHQPDHVSQSQMHYQPLGRPIEERQQGRLPYIAQNQWFDAYHQKTATPVDQWPMYFANHAHQASAPQPQQQQQQQQQHQQQYQTPTQYYDPTHQHLPVPRNFYG